MEIHAFLCCSRMCGFGKARRRSLKSVSSFVGSFGGVRYIAGRRRMPLTPPKEPTREDTLFGDLRRAVPKPHMREQHRNAWISEGTWKLVDERVSARRGPRVLARLRRLGRSIKAILKGDRRPRVEEVGKAVEALLGEDPPNAKEAWRRMKGMILGCTAQFVPPC